MTSHPFTGDRTTADLRGRRALVTGGASGIGAGAARRLVDEGVSVVIADVDESGGRAVAEEIGATFARLDVSERRDWDRVVPGHGPFDIGFLNAGISTGEQREPGSLPVVGLSDAAYRRIMGANVDGVVFGARTLLQHMAATGFGDLVVTASMAGLVPIAPDPVYGLTKHAVVGFVRSLAQAFEQQPDLDVCISAICPGFTDTNIISEQIKAHLDVSGIELMSTAHVADVVVRALVERRQGAQWVIWPGQEVAPYEWSAPFTQLTPETSTA
jgi:NAD(P)-dependent dehydrogenase (short-subunit alcohol dehydrogenase family)